MKIEEPKTPYHHYEQSGESGDDEEKTTRGVRRVSLSNADPHYCDDLASRVAHKIAADGSVPSAMMAAPPGTIDDDELETEEQREHRRAFEERRKEHYNEGKAMQLAKELLAKEMKELEECDDEDSAKDHHSAEMQ